MTMAKSKGKWHRSTFPINVTENKVHMAWLSKLGLRCSSVFSTEKHQKLVWMSSAAFVRMTDGSCYAVLWWQKMTRYNCGAKGHWAFWIREAGVLLKKFIILYRWLYNNNQHWSQIEMQYWLCLCLGHFKFLWINRFYTSPKYFFDVLTSKQDFPARFTSWLLIQTIHHTSLVGMYACTLENQWVKLAPAPV